MTYDLRRLRLKGLIYRPPKTNRYFVTPYGWKVARLFSRLEARVLRPAMAMFTANDAVLPFPLGQALDRVDAQLDLLMFRERMMRYNQRGRTWNSLADASFAFRKRARR
jgi:hypothetical protein